MLVVTDSGAFQLGLALGAASLASIGPTTLMIVREGLAGRRKLLVASMVWSAQISLIAASLAFADAVSGFGAGLRTGALWLGLAFMGWFALKSFGATARPGRLDHRGHLDESALACAVRAIAVVGMNPLTYIERFLLPATLGQSLDTPQARLQFALGLVLMAGVGCYGYALGGSVLLRVLRHRLSCKVFDRASGVLLMGMALSLAFGLALDGP